MRLTLFIAGMNFLFIKQSFDCVFGLYYLRFDNGGQLFSGLLAIGFSALTLFFLGYITYHGGLYTKELNETDKPDKRVDSIRQNHLFSEYDLSHPTCYHYLIA